MVNESKWEPYACLKDLSQLNGRRKQGVMVGDNTDARIARFCFDSSVEKNRQSVRNGKFKGGYIGFQNGKKFDLANQTVDGKPAFIFLFTREIDILWRRQTLGDEIKNRVDKMSPRDKLAATQLIQKLADAEVDNHFFGDFRYLGLFPALSLSQLEDLAQLFAMPSDGHKSVAWSAPA
jgi:hypothetical protein